MTGGSLGTRLPLAPWLATWRGASVNRRILVAMVTVGGVTALLKVAAMAKDMVVASYFGTSDAMDAFLIAFLLPAFAINVVANSFEAALVPVYVRVRDTEGADAARELLATTLVRAGLVFLIAVAVLASVGPLLVAAMGAPFGHAKLALAQRLFFLLVPVVAINGLSVILGAVLNANGRVATASATPIITSICTVGGLLLGGRRWGVYAMAGGLVLGMTIEAALLSWRAYRCGLLAMGRRKHPAAAQVLRQFLPVALGAAIMSNAPLVDQAMAATLGAGSVAALGYGAKVVAAGFGIGVTALSMAVFPHFSAMVAVSDWNALRRTLRIYTGLVVAVSVPLVIAIVHYSQPIVKLVFERGAFSPSDTDLVARVQAAYALQIPFYVLGIMGTRLLSAMQANRTVMWISVVSFVANVAGNFVLMRVWGVVGIALSTSLVYLTSLVLIALAVQRELRRV